MLKLLIALIAGASLFGAVTAANAYFVPDYDFGALYVPPGYVTLPTCVPSWLGTIC
jgi:hypothetical protein